MTLNDVSQAAERINLSLIQTYLEIHRLTHTELQITNPVHILLPVGREREAMSTRCRASDLGNLLVLWDRSIGPQINWLHVRTIRLTWCC